MADASLVLSVRSSPKYVVLPMYVRYADTYVLADVLLFIRSNLAARIGRTDRKTKTNIICQLRF